MNRRYSLYLAFIGLVASILACNAPSQATPTSQAPPPSATSYVPTASPPQETALPTPTGTLPEATPTSAPSATTETTPTSVSATAAPPPTATPTPTPPISAGPLDFIRPAGLDHWENLPDGRYECKIILQITGGAPPYTVHHDLDVFTTWESKPVIVFMAHGCGAMVHTIKVESADGQTVADDYWISPPWCGD